MNFISFGAGLFALSFVMLVSINRDIRHESWFFYTNLFIGASNMTIGIMM